MLSAAKVKIHGMSESKWQCKDKITQFRGCVKLFERDTKVLTTDLNAKRRKLCKTVIDTKKNIVLDRKTLDELIVGDRQRIKNMLAANDITMKLAFGELPPTQIEDAISHRNFLLRKKLDLIRFKSKKSEEKMINVKLYYAHLEDREQELANKTKLEIQGETISGEIQDMILRCDAAVTVGLAYKKIIEIMEKDHCYMNGVIQALEKDSLDQTHCIHVTIDIGQLATEYTDDKRKEFLKLERAIKADRYMRITALKKVGGSVKSLKHNIQTLIRKDSDINMGCKNVVPEQNLLLMENIKELELVLTDIKNIVRVSNFEMIYPCLQNQKAQTTKLKDLLKLSIKNKETLENKVRNAETNIEILSCNMIETTLQYQQNRDKLIEKIQTSKERLEYLKGKIAKKSNLYVNMRVRIKRLCNICIPVKTKPTKGRKKEPLIVEIDGNEINYLKQKLTIIMGQVRNLNEFTNKQKQITYNQYNTLLNKYFYAYQPVEKIVVRSLLEDFTVVDPSIHTRQSIKEESASIVEEYSIDPDLVIVEQKKRR